MLDPRHHARRRALSRTFKVLATLIVVYFLILNIPGLRNAVDQLSDVKPGLLVLGLVLELLALFCYSLMTRAALGPVGHHMWRYISFAFNCQRVRYRVWFQEEVLLARPLVTG